MTTHPHLDPTPTPAQSSRHSSRRHRLLPTLAAAAALALPAHAAVFRLTAEGAAARAAAVSHAAAAAAERVSAADAAVAAADAATRPSLTAAASAAKLSSVPEFRLPFAVPGQPPLVLVPNITTAYTAGLRLQQTLYSGGAIAGGRRAARHDAEASRAARDETDAGLRASGRVAYWQAVRAAAAVDAAEAREQRATRLLTDTESLFAAGMAVNADVLAAKAEVASAGVAVIAARAAAANALAALTSLLRLDGADSVTLADSLVGPLPSRPGPLGELEAAAARRPDLAAATAREAALRAREDVASAPLRPALAAVAAADYNRPNQRYFPTTDRWRDSWSVGVSASWTLYDGGRTRATADASRYGRRAAADDRDELQRAVRLEVETDRRDLESALAQVAAADAAHAAAAEREVAARERHAAGLAPMVEILDAQAQLAASEQQQIDARAASWIAEAVLARAIGR